MSTALDYCDLRTVEILLEGMVTREIPAFVYGGLAAHKAVKNQSLWSLTHLPTGFGFNHWFTAVEGAVEAMVEIHALRNEWETLVAEDLPPLSKPVREICARHGGVLRRKDTYMPLTPLRLNGYSLEGDRS